MLRRAGFGTEEEEISVVEGEIYVMKVRKRLLVVNQHV